ncbi:peroxiredoxin-like family protein [Anthocerotibacter panamensis]|uniref:peroxiredoxin-like family protein n=1 Tax=Anthocerotibacter panamensis TaxID=2857077 RepID=UPI001C4046E6|nr:peroxiredoxin-like family protein [Anthocerotibacter panamensis]
MSLTQELNNVATHIKSQIPAEALSTMGQAMAELIQSGIVDRSLKVGATVPDFTLPNAAGTPVQLSTLLAQGPVVISFYRGAWCPFCNLELHALQQALPEIQALGANLVAISPQTPDNSLTTIEKNSLTFEVLSDSGNTVARQFGIVFQLAESLRPIYANFGIDLPVFNGDTSFELPMPATYVIAPDGRVAYTFVDPDYTKRLEPAQVLEALRSLKA